MKGFSVTHYSKKRVKLHLSSQLDSIRRDRFNGSFRLTFSLSLLGRLPTDVILRPPAALRHVAGGQTKK